MQYLSKESWADLSKESWASVYSANSVDLAYDTFINIFTGLYDKHCRTKRICINGNSGSPKV